MFPTPATGDMSTAFSGGPEGSLCPCETGLDSGGFDPAISPSTEPESASELRRRFEEETAMYRRKLKAYQEDQQKQAEIVQRLQNKVISCYLQ
ncbi:unnamed protein product [Protopolystoma xenopodis]|uniref:Uncharacterized protein n=1 Tax=Protopolystoma xenopodis TaxID=117903 RepID=A0A448XDF4_9PLAT|nr:unnamed protein product [Protopolystoma xenopodis]